MGRCKRTNQLEIHHKRRDGGNTLDNAEVLCHECHTHTSTFGTPGTPPPTFSPSIKEQALKRVGHRCECTRVICGDH
jgi:hypothetical protein